VSGGAQDRDRGPPAPIIRTRGDDWGTRPLCKSSVVGNVIPSALFGADFKFNV
jgi:hypothetical protein